MVASCKLDESLVFGLFVESLKSVLKLIEMVHA